MKHRVSEFDQIEWFGRPEPLTLSTCYRMNRQFETAMGIATLASSRESTRSRNRQNAEDRAEDLMRAALHLFATKDFGRITLRDIQRASGFDAALIYYYFKNKQDLFDATVQFALGEAAGVHHLKTSADADPVQVIRDWLQHSLNM